MTSRPAISITSPGLARTTCSLRNKPSPVAPSKNTTMPKCAIHMPSTSLGRRCQRAARLNCGDGLSCAQISAPIPAASQPINITAASAPIAMSLTNAMPTMPLMAAATAAANIVVLIRCVAPRRHAMTGPNTIITVNTPITGLKVASK